MVQGNEECCEMDRSKAIALVMEVVQRMAAGRGDFPLSLVRELYAFGSVARRALQPGDVDLDFEFDASDRRWAETAVRSSGMAATRSGSYVDSSPAAAGESRSSSTGSQTSTS